MVHNEILIEGVAALIRRQIHLTSLDRLTITLPNVMAVCYTISDDVRPRSPVWTALNEQSDILNGLISTAYKTATEIS